MAADPRMLTWTSSVDLQENRQGLESSLDWLQWGPSMPKSRRDFLVGSKEGNSNASTEE